MTLTTKAAIYGAVTLAALGLAAGQAMAGTNIVTTIPDSSAAGVWTTDNTGAGAVTISSAQADPNISPSTGSLELSAPTTTDQATAINYTSTPFTLSSLVASGTVSFDNYIDSSNTTAPAHFAPAFHLYFGSYSTQLIWEAADNGYSNASGPTRDAWQNLDLANGKWYERINGNSYDIAANTATLSAWLNGTAAIPTGGAAIGNKTITAYSLVAGRDFQGSYTGYVDNVKVGSEVTNFEATQPVPEPSSVAAFAFMGLGAMGLILKARKRKGLTA